MTVKKKRPIINRNHLHKRIECDKINVANNVYCIQNIIKYTLKNGKNRLKIN